MTDVVVVGGGVIGLAVAWRVAAHQTKVVVVDPQPGRGASWAAAGMLAPVSEATFGEDRLLRLNLEAARRYPGFVEELEEVTGCRVGYRRSGTLMAARDADDAAALERLHRFQRSQGLDAQWLTASEVRRLEPALHPGVRAGVLVPEDHQVDNRMLVEALVAACRVSGVELVEDRVTGIIAEDGRARGVRCDDGGVLEADVVVMAAGSWSGRIEGIPENLRPPVRPVKGQLLHLRAGREGPLTDKTIRGFVKGSSFYLVSRGDGRFVLGATAEERGYDQQATAGAVYELLRDCVEVLPGVTELVLEEIAVGLRPGTPDNAPILGPSGLDGLVFATGHYRNGILLTPVTADAVSECIVEGRLPDYAAHFTLGRFAGKEA